MSKQRHPEELWSAIKIHESISPNEPELYELAYF